MRQRFGVPRDGENLFVRQCVSVLAKQFPAPRNRDQFRPVILTINEVHGTPPEGRFMTIRGVLDCALQRADLKSARRSPWSADAGVTPTTIRMT
jgi:hypothetical protein